VRASPLRGWGVRRRRQRALTGHALSARARSSPA
jgi:hypothetical protein